MGEVENLYFKQFTFKISKKNIYVSFITCVREDKE